MFQKILVPYDRSAPSQHALAEALEMSDVFNSHITILNVVDWHDFNAETFKIASRMGGTSGSALEVETFAEVGKEASREDSLAVALEVAPLIEGHDNVDIAIVHGTPHDSITNYAKEGGYDCIVIGHRGLGAVRGMLGSVTYSVLYKTDIPVLVVK